MDLADELLRQTEARIAPRRPLESTYRLQFHAGFTFRDAAALVPYLHDLGITHLYASPYLKARPGSMHGYDIIDHNTLNPEIGTEEDYAAFIAALTQHDMGQILDVVPNHMGVGTNDNEWWNDVLENGPASRHAACFDIAWHASSRPELQDKILLPVLGETYGDALENSRLRLAFDTGRVTIAYYDRRFPIAPRSYAKILGYRIEDLEKSLAGAAEQLAEYQSIVTAIRNLPDRLETEPERLTERQREKEVIKRRLATLATECPPVREFILGNVERFNGTPGQPDSFDLLDDLLDHQCYRLSDWRVAADEINYRRFFDVNDLAALSMERAEVFEATHRLILRLLAEGKIDGFRIDHPDGLYDPAGYFRRLQEQAVLACAAEVAATAGVDWDTVSATVKERLPSSSLVARHPVYVVAEKILASGETLPDNWAVHGTSGYDFLNQVNGLFVLSSEAATFTRLYQAWTDDDTRFSELAYRKKLLILDTSLASELHMLAHQLDRLAQRSRGSRDFTFNTLRTGLREVIACFPVYRSYITDTVGEADRKIVEYAIRRATLRNPLLSRQLFLFLRAMLLLEYPASFNETDRAEQRRFTGKFQQVTSPVTAKGIEDTAFYVYHRLVSLNEVGGEPGRFGISAEALHRYCRERQARWSLSLSPLSTHDTKRSEDVRARINVLSEMASEWQACLTRWGKLNEPLRQKIDDQNVPDANEEYLLYQTLLGAWPLEPYSAEQYRDFVSRIQAYMRKALYEAKVHTSWINPHPQRDQAVQDFIAAVLDETVSAAFLADFRPVQKRLAALGLVNSLAQTVLRLTLPGVPDTYQGSELWDFSLVDPDNRRPVDYEQRRLLLGELRSAEEKDRLGLAHNLLARPNDGRLKLYVTTRALQCRRNHPGLFTSSSYTPLTASGARAEHLFAFARQQEGQRAMVVVPCLVRRLGGDQPWPLGPEIWQDTHINLPSEEGTVWRCLFTGEVLSATRAGAETILEARRLFAHFPVAILLAEST